MAFRMREGLEGRERSVAGGREGGCRRAGEAGSEERVRLSSMPSMPSREMSLSLSLSGWLWGLEESGWLLGGSCGSCSFSFSFFSSAASWGRSGGVMLMP